MIHKACRLYSNQTARWNYGTGNRLLDASMDEVVNFPWMVNKEESNKWLVNLLQ